MSAPRVVRVELERGRVVVLEAGREELPLRLRGEGVLRPPDAAARVRDPVAALRRRAVRVDHAVRRAARRRRTRSGRRRTGSGTDSADRPRCPARGSSSDRGRRASRRVAARLERLPVLAAAGDRGERDVVAREACFCQSSAPSPSSVRLAAPRTAARPARTAARRASFFASAGESSRSVAAAGAAVCDDPSSMTAPTPSAAATTAAIAASPMATRRRRAVRRGFLSGLMLLLSPVIRSPGAIQAPDIRKPRRRTTPRSSARLCSSRLTISALRLRLDSSVASLSRSRSCVGIRSRNR